MSILLTLVDISKTYHLGHNQVMALKNVNLVVNKGELGFSILISNPCRYLFLYQIPVVFF